MAIFNSYVYQRAILRSTACQLSGRWPARLGLRPGPFYCVSLDAQAGAIGNSFTAVHSDGDIFSNIFFWSKCVGQIDATMMQHMSDVHTWIYMYTHHLFGKGGVDVFRVHLEPSQGAAEILSRVKNVQSPAGANFNRSAGWGNISYATSPGNCWRIR